jgi:Nucleotidyl transferase AbiEii toxin, Type IV TA system
MAARKQLKAAILVRRAAKEPRSKRSRLEPRKCTVADLERAWIDDDVVFDVMGLQIDLIRENLEYGSLRIKTNATIGGARVRVVIDIGFGYAVEPGIAELEARLAGAYPRETVIAEKFQAMVVLGRANSRMNDFPIVGFCRVACI